MALLQNKILLIFFMKKGKIIFYFPRILSLLFVAFLTLFSFDVFEEFNGWQTMLAFLIHSLPSIILLIVIIVAWKHESVGAIVFIAAAIFYVIVVGLNRPWSWYAFISGPTALVGILYFLSWRLKK